MKKEYSKPYLLVESFQLDAAIAASCSGDNKEALNYGMDTCELNEGDWAGFGYFGDKCVHDVKVEGDGNDLICYHGPIPASSLFMNS